ncbi:MAG: hypothetical protein C4523_00635 [Myxococcales bacterium]|nr:MAG: hypothetical protein C4523_00635 [Myxococcales bacterium]
MLLKAKDYVTLGNVLGGFYCIVFVIEGNLTYASWAILAAYFCDVMDGVVARLTHQFNKFGEELDNVADLVAYSIAPSFLIYGFYTQQSVFTPLPWYIASFFAAMPTVAGCIRFARFNVKRIHYDGAWMGFPRPAAALLFVGYFNTTMVHAFEPMYWFGLAVVTYSSIMHFVLIPFTNHHGSHTPTYLKWSYFFIASSTVFSIVGGLITGVFITWEIVTFWLLAYLFFHHRLTFSPKQREDIRKFVAEWKADEATLL